MKIILNEKQNNLLVESIICEDKEYPVNPEKVLLVKQFLDQNFKRANMEQMDNNGNPISLPLVGMVDNNGNIIRNLNSHQLFDLLIDKFVNIFSDQIQKNKFIVQIMKDWYNNKITKEGLLSTNLY